MRAPRSTRLAGAALALAALVCLVAEAVVAAAWDARPYSYWRDALTVLGSPDDGRLDGVLVSSPLWWLMDAAWAVAGVLVVGAGLLLARRLRDRPRAALTACALGLGLGLVLFAAFHKDATTQAQGTIALYWAGAGLTLLAGNLFVVVAGLAWRGLGLRRPLGVAGVVLGAVGLVAVVATYGWLPLGAAERVSVYTFLAWLLVAGWSLGSRPRSATYTGDDGLALGGSVVPRVSAAHRSHPPRT